MTRSQARNNISIKIGLRISELQKEIGFSDELMAEQLKIQVGRLRRVKKGYDIKAIELDRIADYFGLNIYDFFEKVPPRSQQESLFSREARSKYSIIEEMAARANELAKDEISEMSFNRFAINLLKNKNIVLEDKKIKGNGNCPPKKEDS